VSDTEFNRSIKVDPLPRGGLEQTIEANPQERAALAALNGLPNIERLSARFLIVKWGKGVAVEGELAAHVTQTCVVSLEPFEIDIDEPIAVKFLPPDAKPPQAASAAHDIEDEDAPDPLIEGRIDLGAIASEFLTLALDPYPRKPGVLFEPSANAPAPESPFSGLRVIADRDEPD
jgi:uncharacterized metal-binding protein YceD (DUF177 family)